MVTYRGSDDITHLITKTSDALNDIILVNTYSKVSIIIILTHQYLTTSLLLFEYHNYIAIGSHDHEGRLLAYFLGGACPSANNVVPLQPGVSYNMS